MHSQNGSKSTFRATAPAFVPSTTRSGTEGSAAAGASPAPTTSAATTSAPTTTTRATRRSSFRTWGSRTTPFIFYNTPRGKLEYPAYYAPVGTVFGNKQIESRKGTPLPQNSQVSSVKRIFKKRNNLIKGHEQSPLIHKSISEEQDLKGKPFDKFYHTSVTCGTTYESFAARLTNFLQQDNLQEALNLIYDCAMIRIHHNLRANQRYDTGHQEAITLMLNLYNTLQDLGTAAHRARISYRKHRGKWTFYLTKGNSTIMVKPESITQLSGGKQRKTRKLRK